MGLLAAACALLFIIIVGFRWLRRGGRAAYPKLDARQRGGMGGPPPIWPLGNVLALRPDPDDFFDQLVGMCNMWQRPRVLRAWLLYWSYVFVFGADELRDLVAPAKNLEKAPEYRMLQPWLGTGLLTAPPQTWKARRKIITPAFHYDILKDFMPVFNKQAQTLVSTLSHSAGRPVDAWRLITLCTLDIICETAMGRCVGAQHNPDLPYVQAVYKGREQSRSVKVLHDFTTSMVRQRAAQSLRQCKDTNNNSDNDDSGKGGKQRLAFLDLLLDSWRGGHLTLEQVRQEVDTFMFEGHDTTSTALNWTLHLLGNDPRAQRLAAAECDSAFERGSAVNYEQLGELTYLECCIKEALRLYPPVPLFSRRLDRDQEIGGCPVGAGTGVVVCLYTLHRDPQHWPDPEAFVPERFLPQNAQNRHPYAYAPFSAAARNCIGQRFALMEEKVLLAWILRKFSVRSLHRRDQMRPKAELILRPATGNWLTFEPRAH